MNTLHCAPVPGVPRRSHIHLHARACAHERSNIGKRRGTARDTGQAGQGALRKSLPPPLPAPPVDERLVTSIATETAIPAAQVARWLAGNMVPGSLLGTLRTALWRPPGGFR
jgi:hypothetical protein